MIFQILNLEPNSSKANLKTSNSYSYEKTRFKLNPESDDLKFQVPIV